MKTLTAMVLALQASGCGLLGIADNPMPKVSVNGSDVMFTSEGERVILYNSLADPNGLAGIEVEMSGTILGFVPGQCTGSCEY